MNRIVHHNSMKWKSQIPYLGNYGRRGERLARLRRRCSKMTARMNETKTTMATVTAIEVAPISNGEDRPKKSERVPPMNSNMAAIIATQAYRYLNDVLA